MQYRKVTQGDLFLNKKKSNHILFSILGKICGEITSKEQTYSGDKTQRIYETDIENSATFKLRDEGSFFSARFIEAIEGLVIGKLSKKGIKKAQKFYNDNK